MNRIELYSFQDAPESLKELSNSGGDEDWLAIVPKGMKSPWDGRHDHYAFMGWTQYHKCKNYDVIIFSHS